MLVIGLTGSIGMGKSVTADLFRRAGVPVHDSDAAVHHLYESSATPLIESAFPGVSQNGRVDRAALAAKVLDDTGAMRRLESIVHPLVRQDRADFLARCEAAGASVVVLDIPLLFETGCEQETTIIAVVDAPETVQKSRVLARPGMTLLHFESILARQMSRSEKRKRAHVVIDTSRGVDAAERQVRALLRALAGVVGDKD